MKWPFPEKAFFFQRSKCFFMFHLISLAKEKLMRKIARTKSYRQIFKKSKKNSLSHGQFKGGFYWWSIFKCSKMCSNVFWEVCVCMCSHLFLSLRREISWVCRSICFSSRLVKSEYSSSWISRRLVWFNTYRLIKNNQQEKKSITH